MPLRIQSTALVDSKEVERVLRQTRRRVKNWRPLLEGSITNRVHEMFRKIWDTKGAYIGQRWAPLTPSTLTSKARVNRAGMGILRRHNTLWASLTKRGGQQQVRIVRDDELIIGTTVPYGPPHQLGAPRSGIPQRKFVPDTDDLPQKEVREWERLTVRYLERGR